jgi:chromosome segregation ATPase
MDAANDLHRTSISTLHDPGVQMRKDRREREIRTKERSWWNPKRWFGNKWHTSIEQYDEEIPDYTEHNFYLKQKAELEKEHQDRMLDLAARRRELEEKLSGLLKGSREARKFQIDREELEVQIAKLREERDEKLDNVIKKQLKKAGAYVESIFDSLERDSRKQALQALADKETKLCEMAMQILEGEIKDELDIKMKKLESLKKKMTQAEQDKDQRLHKIEEIRADLKELAKKAVALHGKIDSIVTDKISEQ